MCKRKRGRPISAPTIRKSINIPEDAFKLLQARAKREKTSPHFEMVRAIRRLVGLE